MLADLACTNVLSTQACSQDLGVLKVTPEVEFVSSRFREVRRDLAQAREAQETAAQNIVDMLKAMRTNQNDKLQEINKALKSQHQKTSRIEDRASAAHQVYIGPNLSGYQMSWKEQVAQHI